LIFPAAKPGIEDVMIRSKQKKRFYVLASLGLAASILLGTGARGQELDDYPAHPAKDMILERCGICHSLQNVRSGDYDALGWREILHQMRNIGAALNDDELDLLAGYLTVNSPQSPRPEAVIIPGNVEIEITEWEVPTQGSMPRDVAVAPNGKFWFSGMFASLLIELDPTTGELIEHKLRPYSAPMGVAADENGEIWFASNRRGYIGKLDPATGALGDYPMPDEMAPDPSDIVVDQNGKLWFTAQNGNVVGRIAPPNGEFQFISMPREETSPFAIALAPDGAVFAGLRDSKSILRIDPQNFTTREYPLTGPETEPRRLAISDDGLVWYADIDRGYLGRLDPQTGAVAEYLSPSGPLSEPHGIAAIGNIVWYVEAGANPNVLVRFDPASERFQSWPLSGFGVVRDLAATKQGDLAFAMGSLNRVGLIEISE
jgi:virginiamycin B lyase